MLFLLLISLSAAQDTCPDSTPVTNRVLFWTGLDSAHPEATISHIQTPTTVGNGYTLDFGNLGINKYADPAFRQSMDTAGAKWEFGTVNSDGSPANTTGGYPLATTAVHDNFNNGLDPKLWNINIQANKKFSVNNVDIVLDTVNGVQKNVLRLAANRSGTSVTGAAAVQSMGLFSSARYEVIAKFPAVHGLVFAVWTFHYEEHYNNTDPQFVQGVSGAPFTMTNHEIDIEIPANCGAFGASPGRYDTMNLNNYIYTNENGGGPSYANVCVKTPSGKTFIDGKNYHTYAFEWHAGNNATGCQPRVDWFFDGDYIGTVNVFAPTRGSRLVVALWPGNSNWVGTADDWNATEVYAYVSEINICPFKEDNDFQYPQNYDQPPSSTTWTTKTIPPAKSGLPGPTSQCRTSSAHLTE